MSLETDIKLLGTVPLLSDFSEDRLRLLAFSAESRAFKDGQCLFTTGDRADCAYVVSQGQVAIFTPDNAETPAELASRGTLIGDLALIIDCERPFTAIARGKVDTILIRRPLFRRMLEEFPDIAASLHRRLSRGVRETSHRLMSVRNRLDGLGG